MLGLRYKARVAIWALLAGMWPMVVFAIDQADTFNIVSARAYGAVIETGDILVVVHYDIDYTSVPTETASQAYLGYYSDVSATPTQRISTAPFVYVRSGYGQGVMSLYLSVANVSSWGITWGDSDNAQIAGNPAYFASPQVLNRAIEWRIQTASASTLEGDLRGIANTLETQSEWSGADLISGGNLTTTGEDYFTNAIPNLRSMAPDLFTGSLENPDFGERTHGTSYQDSLDTFWDGSALASNWDNLASWFNLPVNMVTTMVVIGLAIGVGVWAQAQSGEALVTLPVISVVLVGGTLINWVPVQLTAILGFFGLMVIAFALWLKRAAA